MSERTCYHCGDEIIGKSYTYAEHAFCCNGCKSVYQLLTENGLETFYSIEDQPGAKPSKEQDHKYAFLEVEDIRKKFIDFEDDTSTHVTLFLPQIHCSSCIYLLENLHKIEPRVHSSQVNFSKREANLIFSTELKLAELAKLLDKIGYAPNFGNRQEQSKKRNHQYLYKLGVAGFAFGSIMLWSFPEYLGIEDDNPEFRNFTSYLSLAVSIPVLLYSAREYLVSAYKAIRHKSINLDVPITLGILALYFQSAYTILAGLGPGYMDSFAGFIFFLLIGKWFQNKTYDSLSFERDYKSYFPVAVTRMNNNKEEIVEIDNLEIGDTLGIRNLEIIPCDATLLSEEVKIDYSFVTGESVPVTKRKGDFIYAGGKLLGQQSLFSVEKESSRSHLTQLWNDAGEKEKTAEKQSDRVSIYFLIGVLLIAAATGIAWSFTNLGRTTEVVVSVLIVACPCALALSKPFTYGNTMRSMGRKGLYLKNATITEKINSITDIVFDKTGTLTTGSTDHVDFIGESLTQEDIDQIVTLTNSSTHPLSRAIVDFLKPRLSNKDISIENFKEHDGQGISGKINGRKLQLGSAKFAHPEAIKASNETSSHVSIDGKYLGRFVFASEFRPEVLNSLRSLQKNYTIHILSGDKDADAAEIKNSLPEIKEMHFEQSPGDKLAYIKRLEKEGANIMMIGDGLNDSGALETATVGIAVSEDIFRFTPSSDAIIEGNKLHRLGRFFLSAKRAERVLIICYIFSIIYNIVGLSFAITGNLTPLIAAILMPLSSISIVLISTLLTASRY